MVQTKKELENNEDLSIPELVQIYKQNGRKALDLLEELKELKSKGSD